MVILTSLIFTYSEIDRAILDRNSKSVKGTWESQLGGCSMRSRRQKAIIVAILLVVSISVVIAAEAPANQQTQSVVVNVNVPQASMVPVGVDLVAANTHSIGLGISTPIYGKEHNVIRNGEVFTEKLTGINLALGYTWRHYFGDGLPQKGGALYWEFLTMAIIVPMVGIGYEYRFNDTFRIGVGFPDVLSVRISL
jgi:hypothetical protein